MKTITTVSVDPYLLEKAHKGRLNVSGVLDDALRLKTGSTKKDAPDKALVLKCTQCLKEIEYGFLCRERELFLCQECQDSFNMGRCPHDKSGQHLHVRIPGFDGQNKEYMHQVEKILNDK